MENLTIFEAPPVEFCVGGGIAEMKFRCAAGLCRHCGMMWPAHHSLICENCQEQVEIEAMEAQWRAWGIAA